MWDSRLACLDDRQDAYLTTIERINPRDRNGRPMVRIHALGFPLPQNVPQYTSVRYATLMRIVSARNGGTFVGLTAESFEAARRGRS